MKFQLLGLALILLTGCKESRENSTPHHGISREEAVDSAIKSISAQYPDISKNVEDWNARYENKIWTVYPKMPEGHLGGGPSARIAEGNGDVEVLFSE